VDSAAVVERLRSELSERNISLCTAAPRKPAAAPIANVVLTPVASADRISLDIEVRDEVTSKRVGRVVDLSGVPSDGRAIVVALAVAELLRASWAELALDGAKPREHAPPEVRAAVEPKRPEQRASLQVGVRGAAEWWSGGLPLLGGDGALSWHPTERFSADLLAGARVAPDETSQSGTVSVTAFVLRAGGGVALTRPDARAAVFVGARASAYVLRLDGEPSASSEGASETALAIAVESGPRLLLPLGAGLHLSVDAALGVALRGVEGRDVGSAVTGLTGIGGVLALGILAGGGS
jgi:hypothetical protein